MRQLHILVSAFAYLLMFFSATSHATLIGVLPATPGGTDWQAYYDDEADLTWLANAYMAGTLMSWDDASAWAAGLDINGVTGWRLPTTQQPDPGCSIQDVDASWGFNCSGSEMGNLYYNVLGNTAGGPVTNTGPFTNIQTVPLVGSAAQSYWSSTKYAPNPAFPWKFRFSDGVQDSGNVTNNYAWAVHDGNVSAVPAPPALWLCCSGLLGLLGLARRKTTG